MEALGLGFDPTYFRAITITNAAEEQIVVMEEVFVDHRPVYMFPTTTWCIAEVEA